MQTAKEIHKGIDYEFLFIEGIVYVLKDNVFTYILKPVEKGWDCNCKSGYWRKYCWHEDFCKENFIKDSSPAQSWIEKIEEEYILNWLTK